MSARDTALIELDQRTLPNWRPHAIKRYLSADARTDPRDRALAENIVAGVVKNLLLLQHLTQHYSGRSLKSIDAAVQKIVAIALYQLRFLSRIPASAAVDEAVEQTRRFGFRSASGFVNAVLRKATREPNPPLPNEQDNPRDFARLLLSHPTEVFDRLVSLAGVEEALRICRHDQTEAPTIVRLFPGVTVDQLTRPGVTLSRHKEADLVVVEPAKQQVLAEWAAAGLAQAQDPTSAAVVNALDARVGQTVLDRCCGRGTKTIQLQAAVGATGRVIAVDPAAERIASLRSTLKQRRIENIDVFQAAMLSELGDAAPTHFDRILIDAPCSNSGVLARRGEARYRQTSESLKSIAKLQSAILNDSAPAVVPGGRLAYATCSIWSEENEAIVAKFVKKHPGFAIISQRSTLPMSDGDSANYHDGGYVAILERRDDMRQVQTSLSFSSSDLRAHRIAAPPHAMPMRLADDGLPHDRRRLLRLGDAQPARRGTAASPRPH